MKNKLQLLIPSI